MDQFAPFSRLKVALIADGLTRVCLAQECRVMNVTPWNSALVFRYWKPDLLLVESAWEGWWGSWRYRVAAYPDRTDRNNDLLAGVVRAARQAHIPCVFWNREDGVHFDRFIASARLFDHIYTVDENKVRHYQAAFGDDTPVKVLMFAAQPAFHFPAEASLIRRLSFVGSYGRHVHAGRREWQDMILHAANHIGVTVYDRNSGRSSTHYRYPNYSWIEMRRAIPHARTADVYRGHVANLNVNTISDSPTAFSRRLVEILACGGFAVTNPTLAVMRHFQAFCELVDSEEAARDIFNRLKRDGWSARDVKRGRAGADHVLRHHTWRHRLSQLAEVLK